MARGSKPGERRGGRQKGTPNKRTTEMFAELSQGEMPLDYMLKRMRDPQVPYETRDRLAAAAAPYCHARLASMEVAGKDGKDLIPDSTSEFDKARLIAHVLSSAMHGETRH